MHSASPSRATSHRVLLAVALSTVSCVVATACGRDEPQFRPATRDDNAGEPAAAADRPAHADEPPTRDAPEPAAEGALPAPPDVAAAPSDAARTTTGLASKVIRPGTGTVHPGPRDRVTVHYTGWTTDGRMFDSSVTRGEPATFPLDRVIPGWTEGVQLMVEG
jgi:FKBP-type peptidyl-prolyl cis-trans isomerase